MQKQPLFILLLSFCAGIILQDYLSLSIWVLFILLTGSALSVFVFFTGSISFLRFKTFFIIFISCCSGIALHFLQVQKPSFPDLKKEERLIFKLEKKMKSGEKSRKYEVTAWKSNGDAVSDPRSFYSILLIPKTAPELDFRHIYKARAYISKVPAPQHDYQFNYQKYLRRKNIDHQIYLPEGFMQTSRKTLTFQDQIRQKRLVLLQKIDHSKLSSQTREIIKGIILADRTEMNAELTSDFQRTGLVHILAISGTHIAIIFGIFYFIFIKIFPVRLKKYGIISSLVLIWIFAIFIGLGNSVVRACIMLTVYFTYVILQRKTDFLHSMSLAAFLILGCSTHQLFDVGFQLSFSAVLGIYWFNGPVLKWFPKRQNKVASLFTGIFSVTTSAQLGTMPLVLFYFHQYSLLSVAANLIILPVVEILIVGALVITIIIASGLELAWIFIIFDVFVKYTLALIHWLSTFDLFLFDQIPLNEPEVILLFVALYFLRFLFQKFSVKNGIRFIYVIVLFSALRLGLHYYYLEKVEILSHQFYKSHIISTKDKGEVIFYVKEDLDEKKVLQFIIFPYLTARRTSDFKIIKVPKDQNYIRFGGVKYDLE